MIAEAIDLKRELYLSILMDREHGGPVFVASQKVSSLALFQINFVKGGMDIEEVARTDPGAIITVPVNINTGPTDEQLVGLATSLGFKKDLIPQAVTQLRCLYNMFLDLDCTQVEVNPFAETPEGLSKPSEKTLVNSFSLCG
jgi:succinyl-CoA synthetase beta subunit